MSEAGPAVDTDEPPIDKVDIDLRAWVEAARADPVLYRDRQVTEIVLTAIGLAPDLRQSLVLKGGTLMAIAFHSRRVTADVDFSATVEPDGFPELLTAELDNAMPRAAVRLGYLDLACRIQGVKRHPRPQNFENADFPALEVRVASAKRSDPNQMAALEQGRAERVLKVEVTFRDQVYAFQELMLTDAKVAVQAFSPTEIVAEKLRALLQQPIRNRNRRQDVYDVAFLIEQHAFDESARAEIHRTLVAKCQSRNIEPTLTSIADPEVKERAQKDWDTLRLELADLGDFDERFEAVRAFYEALPWQAAVETVC